MKKQYSETLKDLIERTKLFQIEYEIHDDAMFPLLIDLYQDFRENHSE